VKEKSGGISPFLPAKSTLAGADDSIIIISVISYQLPLSVFFALFFTFTFLRGSGELVKQPFRRCRVVFPAPLFDVMQFFLDFMNRFDSGLCLRLFPKDNNVRRRKKKKY